MLSIEHSSSIPIVSKAPTMILGMDVSHGSPGQSDVPSIAAVNNILSCNNLQVYFIYRIILPLFSDFFCPCSLLNLQVVSSRQWPLISKYRAVVRTQSPKVEMIDNLFKPVSDKEDEGIIRFLKSKMNTF